MDGAARRLLIDAALLVLLTTAALVNTRDLMATDQSRWVLASFLAAAVGVLAINILWWINGQFCATLTPAQAASESFAVGLSFGLAQVGAAALIGPELVLSPALTLVSVTVSTTAFGVLAILIGQAWRHEHERLRQLGQEGLDLELARAGASEIVREMQVALASDIEVALSPARISIERRLHEQERMLMSQDWSSVATELRTTASQTVRPLSRRLWTYPSRPLERPGLGRILRTIVSEQPFQPAVLILLYWATALAGTATNLGWGTGLAVMAVGSLIIAGTLGGANLLMTHVPRRHAVIFVAGAVVLQLTGLLTFAVRGAWSAVPYTWTEFILAAISGFTLILVTSGFGSALTYREDLARTFHADIDGTLMESVVAGLHVARLARESARILHGSVQTRLVACAVAIERASLTRDVEAFRTAMHEARAALAAPSFEANDAGSLGEQLEHTVSLWRGLCSIHVNVDAPLRELRGGIASDVCRVVEEAINNGITHGEASDIHVDVKCRDGAIIVTIVDDGTGPGGDAPGLGSALLDSICQEWNLSGTGAGSMLRAVIAAKAHASAEEISC